MNIVKYVIQRAMESGHCEVNKRQGRTLLMDGASVRLVSWHCWSCGLAMMNGNGNQKEHLCDPCLEAMTAAG